MLLKGGDTKNLEQNRAAKRRQYEEDLEKNRAAKRRRYEEGNRAAKREKYDDNSAAIKASERSPYWNDPSVQSAKPRGMLWHVVLTCIHM